MADIIHIPENFIGLEDREKLDSFAGHSIARGRATRWHWDHNEQGDDVFELYRGGADEQLTARVTRSRNEDAFFAHDEHGKLISSGELDHLLAGLDKYLMKLHGETPDTPA